MVQFYFGVSTSVHQLRETFSPEKSRGKTEILLLLIDENLKRVVCGEC